MKTLTLANSAVSITYSGLILYSLSVPSFKISYVSAFKSLRDRSAVRQAKPDFSRPRIPALPEPEVTSGWTSARSIYYAYLSVF